MSVMYWKERSVHKCQTDNGDSTMRSVSVEVIIGSLVPPDLVAEQVDGSVCRRECHASCVPRGVAAWCVPMEDDGEAEAGRVIYLDFIGGIARL